MNLNEIDDDDLMLDDEPVESLESEQDTSGWSKASMEEDEEEETVSNNYFEDSTDAVEDFLKDNGIEDPNRIKFETENGDIEERSWKDLSKDEQLNILRSSQREPEEGLDDEEIEFINLLRANGLTPSLYLALIQQQMESLMEQLQLAVQTALANKLEPSYTSDLLTDDELYILDLQSRLGEDATDEELEQALITAKSNEDFYLKLIAGIRAEYQRLEAENAEREAAIQRQQIQDEYDLYSNVVFNEINNLNNIGDLDISMKNDERNELAEFMLNFDENGENYFEKALKDPETSVLMAWFALHGEELFNSLSDYYTNLIAQAAKDGYERGKKESASKSNQKNSLVEYRPKQNKHSTSKSYTDISDLD